MCVCSCTGTCVWVEVRGPILGGSSLSFTLVGPGDQGYQVVSLGALPLIS